MNEPTDIRAETTASLNIVADHHIWGVKSAFSTLPGFNVHLKLLENKQITCASLHDVDILLTRSSTRVNADLLAGTPVRFAATATIGDDHYDQEWLDKQGIHWANAAGSSTGSVLEYMMTVLLNLHARAYINIPDTTIGIIGVGRIGSALATLCESMGMRVLRNDPPRARQEEGDQFCSLDDVLAQADVISMHTPLIRKGGDCTVHLLSRQQLEAFQGKGVINAGRGSCVDNGALYRWLDAGHGHFAVLDCWEHEPTPRSGLIHHPGMAISTPHIAGHSIEGKAANSQYIYHALCRFLNIHPTWDMHDELPEHPAPVVLHLEADMWSTLHAAALSLYPIQHDHTAMQAWGDLSDSRLAQAFTHYRRNYPARRAWQHAPIHIKHADAAILHMAQAIGIKIV